MVARRWASPRESAEFPTEVKNVLTLLVNAQQAIPNAIGVHVIRGIVSAALASNRRMYARFAARFCINQQSLSWPCL